MSESDLRPLIVTVPTFRRQELLRVLLPEVRAQLNAYDGPTRLVVVDNDPEHTAKAAAHDAGVEYVSESTPGIGAVRRRALDLSEGPELVIMIDDDVAPTETWLEDLLATWRRTRATVVVGFVKYIWPDGTPDSITLGGYMRRTPRTDGESLNDVATSNVLIDAAAARALGVTFARDLGLSGGEDTLFGREVIAAGGSVSASASRVIDTVPADRATLSFVSRRAFSHGSTASRLALRGKHGAGLLTGRISATLGGVVRLIVFSGIEVVGRWGRHVPRAANARRRRIFALGRIVGAWRVPEGEYAAGRANA